MKNWRDEVLNEGHQKIIVRASRRAGKTRVAIEWAGTAGRNVVYVVPTSAQADVIWDEMRAYYHDKIITAVKSNRYIKLENGTQIHVMQATARHIAGMRVDAIVFDEVGCMNRESVINFMTRLSGSRKILALYTMNTLDGLEILEGMEAHHVSVDYLDLLENGILSSDDVRNIYSSMTHAAFEREMGPYEKPKNKVYRNKDYKHLLSQTR